MIIDGKKVAEEYKEKLKNMIDSNNLSPALAVIQIGDNESSNIYIKQKEKMCNELGISFQLYRFSNDEDIEVIKKQILKLNKDKKVNGIILQLPIPLKYNVRELVNIIDPKKDADGLTDTNKINLINHVDTIIPCTALGIIELLNYYKISVSGKNIVIIGRSDLVSKPLYNLLLNRDATVTMCHTKTKKLKEHTKKADILISATGQSHLIKKDMVKKGTVIIDVGISRINNKIYGDADYKNILKKASYITPVPGGVGPMTVIMLMKNVIENSLK